MLLIWPLISVMTTGLRFIWTIYIIFYEAYYKTWMQLSNFMERVILQADDRSVRKEISFFLRSGFASSFSHESVILVYCKRLEFGPHARICNTILPFPNTCVFMTFSKTRTLLRTMHLFCVILRRCMSYRWHVASNGMQKGCLSLRICRTKVTVYLMVWKERVTHEIFQS